MPAFQSNKYTPENPPKKLGDLYPEPYLYAYDLKPEGHIVKIEKVTFELFPPRPGAHNQAKVLCAVLHFERANKALILNKTKSEQLAAALNRDFSELSYDELPGNRIFLWPGQGQNNSQVVNIAGVKNDS